MSKKGSGKNWLILAAGADEAHALAMQQALRAGNRRADIALWRADIPGTEVRELARDIERLLERAVGVIGLLSKIGLEAGMPRAVWLTVLRDYLLGTRPFLPIRIEPCDPGPLLGQLPFVDFQSGHPEQGLNALYQRLYGLEQFPAQIGSNRADLTHLPGLAQSERAAALVHLARQLKDISDTESAVSCLMAALTIRERILSPADPLLSATLLTAAEVTLAAGHAESARTHLLAAYNRLHQSPWGSKTLLQQWNQLERLAELARASGDASLSTSIVQLQRDMLPRMRGSDFDAGLVEARAGRLAREAGDIQGAIDHFLAALAAWRKEAPEEPAEWPRLLNDLGTLSLQQGEVAAAEGFLTEALTRWRALRGDTALEVATTCANLSALYRVAGRLDLARSHLLESLRIRQQQLDPLDPGMGTALHQLAALEEAEGGLSDAEAHYRQALLILTQHAGSLAEAATVRNNLALLLEKQGRHAEASALLDESWNLVCSRFGPAHPSCVPMLENTAAHLERTGQLAAAMDRRQSLIGMMADDPAQVGECVRQWRLTALLAARLGQTEVAEGALREAERLLASLPAEHPEHAALRPLRQKLSGPSGDVAGQVRLLEASLHDLLQRVDSSDPVLIAPMEELALLQEQLGDYGDAATYLERVLQMRERAWGRQHPDLIPLLLQLGRVLKAKGSKGRAASLGKRAQQLIQSIPAAHPEWLAQATALQST